MKGYVLFSCLLCITGVIPQFFGSETFSLTNDPRYLITGSGTLNSARGGFINANPPAASTLTIQRVNNQYSQVRLDFRTLTLEQPNLDGLCTINSILFTGQLKPATFILCGANTGQHVYLNFNGLTNIVITIVPSAASAWGIEVTQLKASDALFAPTNCLQYFTTSTGIISSFNYGVHTTGPRQISNLNYLACVSTQTTFDSITYTSPGAYLVTGDPATPGVDYETDYACLTDYIEFRPGTQYVDLAGSGATVTRFCGSLFPLAGVTSTNGNVTATYFPLRIVTNAVEETNDADLLNVGFSFTYASSVTCIIGADVITGSGTLNSARGGFINANPPAVSTLTIQRVNNQYNQVRLDFRTLTLDQPNLDGLCTINSITFTGQLYPVTFALCGVNTGQHVYLNFNGFTNIVITIVPSAASAWAIEVTQLRTSDALFAPTNCLQYFTDPTGTISSFNYGVHTSGPRQISNLDYLACVSTQTTFCSITYNSPGAYLVTGDPATRVVDYKTDAACLTDYIEFRPGSKYGHLDGSVATVTRFCGSLFPLSGVTSTNGNVAPTFFPLRIFTNAVEQTTDGDMMNVGFSFNYCSSSPCYMVL